MKSEDLHEANYCKDLRRIEIITDHNKTQTHFIHTDSSHWQLRLSHCLPHTACILTPLA